MCTEFGQKCLLDFWLTCKNIGVVLIATFRERPSNVALFGFERRLGGAVTTSPNSTLSARKYSFVYQRLSTKKMEWNQIYCELIHCTSISDRYASNLLNAQSLLNFSFAVFVPLAFLSSFLFSVVNA